MEPTPRAGDEIFIAGQPVHTGARVITWQDPGGYNAYGGRPPSSLRVGSLSDSAQRRIADHGWTIRTLGKVVDQFVLHYDASGVSKVAFRALQQRGLSVHFLLDVDGTIYQTLDLQERALHATTSNDRSIGIEIANIGAYPANERAVLERWYRRELDGSTTLHIPERFGEAGIATSDFKGRPARPFPIEGVVQNRALSQYDFTPEQYAALAALTAALCRSFPRLACEYPHTDDGAVIPHKLAEDALVRYHGILGHFHIQENKVDPGPAFDWERFMTGVRRALREAGGSPVPANPVEWRE